MIKTCLSGSYLCFALIFASATAHAEGDESTFARISNQCSPEWRVTLLDAARDARKDIQSLMASTDEALENGYDRATSKRLKAARSTLECMARKMETTTIECESPQSEACFGVAAWAVPRGAGQVHFCLGFFSENEKRRRGTMVHEFSHLCGTNDAAYFFHGMSTSNKTVMLPTPSDVSLTKWSKIADTYGFWARNGFCVPDVNCVEPAR